MYTKQAAGGGSILGRLVHALARLSRKIVTKPSLLSFGIASMLACLRKQFCPLLWNLASQYDATLQPFVSAHRITHANADRTKLVSYVLSAMSYMPVKSLPWYSHAALMAAVLQGVKAATTSCSSTTCRVEMLFMII